MSAPSVPALRAAARDRVMQLTGIALLVDTGLALFKDIDGGRAPAAVGWLLALAAWLALAFARRWPMAVSVVTLLLACAYYPLSLADGPTVMVAFIVSLYFVARSGQLAAALTIAALTTLLLAYTELMVFEDDQHVEPASIALLSGWLLSVIAFGHAMLIRHAYQHEAEQRALAAERERDVRARQSATEERLRIARELHDVLGHNISLINVQASAAVHRSAKRPGETAELVQALESVRETSREALRELRATLGVLRQVDEAAPTAPAAGLDRLGELAERAGAAGLDVTVETTGEPPVVPPQISLAAYRIVQESLTNVTRHARAAHAVVRVEYEPGELRVRIEDDGRGSVGGDTSGSGIRGMAERARALGGELAAVDTGSGFRVAARLPLPAESAEGEGL
ncbi:sensor histidine kinase [Streptomyces sp. 6N223]|uniref:sensor histidine kinase n=1 Tax=Streptomyces sp. 6N223 TaxID=3457412 RepID=UPI003FD64CB1